MKYRKTPSESELIGLLQAGQVQLSPFIISIQGINPSVDGGRVDAILRLTWENRRYQFAAECNRLWTPKALSYAVAQVRQYAKPLELYPLVIVPYLPDDRLAELEKEGVSGIDLCGNGVVIVPNELLVYRTGQPNRFRSEAEIKNVFRGISSLVARVFLEVSEYTSVQEVRQEILKRGGKAVLPTVSKVCKSLESMLVIARSRAKGSAARQLRLLQPEKLLDLLTTNYVAPVVRDTTRGKTKLTPETFRERLSRSEARVVQTGFGSVGNYAVMAKEPMQYFYTSDLTTTCRELGDAFEPTDRFANVTLSETKDETVYFDMRPVLVASPVQTYLELTTGDKRSRETAEQVRRAILTPLGAVGRREG